MQSAGLHLIIELFGVNFHLLDDQVYIENLLQSAANKADCTILHSYSFKFEPFGLTSIVVLAESHISFHSYCEYGYAALDIFSCGPKAMPEKALEIITAELKPKKVETKRIVRGEGLDTTSNTWTKRDINTLLDQFPNIDLVSTSLNKPKKEVEEKALMFGLL